MLLLHISDVHFRAPQCAMPDLDPERPYRTALLNDVRTRVKTLGPVGAILVGGDVAFRGAAEEYTAAFAWLQELTVAASCSLDRVFLVPGNHDIDRSIIRDQPSVRNAQQAVLRAEDAKRERELFTQFVNGETGRALLAAHAMYNEFAKRFDCQLFSRERLYWRQDLDLNEVVKLRVHGLTSTLFSGAPNGDDDVRGSLYLSPLQTVFDPIDNVVNLVLCHHPPDWLQDQDEVEDALSARASIQMFGHKHRQRIVREAAYVRFSAGAVNPDRAEPGWRPGYNLISLRVAADGPALCVEVDAHLLAWQTNPDAFTPIVTADGDPVFKHRLSVRTPGVGNSTSITLLTPPEAERSGTTPAPAPPAVEVAMSDQRTRNLIFRFWNLASSQRRDITLALGLIGEEDLRLPEAERYGRALLRAGERGLLERVAEEVEALEKR